MFNHALDFSALELASSEILNEIGYGKVLPEDEVLAITDTLLTEVSSFVKPSCTFDVFDGEISGASSILIGQYTLEAGEIITSLLAGVKRFCLFVATAGELFQDFQDKIKRQGDILQTFVLDIIGTCIVEKTGDIMEKLLEKEITGFRHTHRFSPGYCGWSLTEQKQLFDLLGGDPSGVTLLDSCLMMPVKSISGIIGIGKKVNEKQYGCNFCELETCYKRKK